MRDRPRGRGAAAHRPPDAIVFWNEPDVYLYARPGVALGPYTLLDGAGRSVPIANNSNVLEPGDEVFRYAGDQRLALASLQLMGGASREWFGWMFGIVPVTPEQKAILRIALGPPVFDERPSPQQPTWTYDLVPQSGGPPAIEMGLADPTIMSPGQWRASRSRPGQGRTPAPEAALRRAFSASMKPAATPMACFSGTWPRQRR